MQKALPCGPQDLLAGDKFNLTLFDMMNLAGLGIEELFVNCHLETNFVHIFEATSVDRF